MVFKKPETKLVCETFLGQLIFDEKEYFILENEALMINKSGIQKIEDKFSTTTEIVKVGEVLGNIYVHIKMTTDSLSVERLGSANRLNLTDNISRAYAVEMAFKRAAATAALEILRKNSKKDLPLLYSSFDEFKSDNTNKDDDTNDDNTNNIKNYIIKTKKYKNGITIENLVSQDIDHIREIVNTKKVFGIYKEYQNKIKEYIEEFKINI